MSSENISDTHDGMLHAITELILFHLYDTEIVKRMTAQTTDRTKKLFLNIIYSRKAFRISFTTSFVRDMKYVPKVFLN